MVLIAATAIALVPIRYVTGFSFPGEAVHTAWTFESVWSIILGSQWILTPLLVTWSLALWILRLRRPRPRLRRLFRQPGMAATTVVLLSVVLLLFRFLALCAVAFLEDPNLFARAGEGLTLDVLFVFSKQYTSELCDALLAVWLVLWLAGAWRSERSWIDRAGRTLGVLGVVYGLLFSFFAIMV